MANPISISTPLAPADLFFESMNMSSGLSTLGEMQLGLLSEKSGLKPQDLLGKSVTVHVEMQEGKKRHFNGIVTRFGMGAHRGRYFGYTATVRPWLWFLTRTSDCRIFQEMSVPDIVKKVFGDHGIANFEFKLFRQYHAWTYCVQYRESDFSFVARLLEHEGIYWYFEHTDGAHKLVLVDSHSAHDAAPGYETLRYTEQASATSTKEFVWDWVFSESVRTGKSVLTSYDFERPSTSLEVENVHSRKYELSDYEGFDFQGDYIDKADGTQYAENRMEEIQTRFAQGRGSSNALGLATGRTFKLTNHPRNDQNAEYLVTTLAVQATLAVFESSDVGTSLICQFTTIPSAQQFRPARRTKKPFVQGPQTAQVVGPSGDEIFTDKYGRVKVQFHWDRLGKRDEKSSCWVRVSTPWAGKNFGMVQIPRIGQEVVVDFLEGDPDQPLITGRVYNAEQMPPWELPANATQSGILTRSSKGGSYGNSNAIRFEDKKGSEQLWLHAEKNQDIEVENDETHWVGHDRTKTVDHDEVVQVKHDRTETVGNNETITIGVNRSETVGSNETISIGANRTETVGANETISIGANRSISVGASETATVALQRTHAVGINETIAIGAAQEVAIGAAQSITVGANQSTSVGRNQSNTIGAKQDTDVGSDRTIKVGGAQSTKVAKARMAEVGEDDSVMVGKNWVVEAKDSISFKTGSATLTMKKDGTIVLKGKDIQIEGSGKINVKASSDVSIKGSKVGVN
jgi:type VI secretion system secreted protein VgrG